MNTVQKAQVWLSAMNAVNLSESVNFGTKTLLSNDVAKALGLIARVDEGLFKLHANKGGAYPAGKLLASVKFNG